MRRTSRAYISGLRVAFLNLPGNSRKSRKFPPNIRELNLRELEEKGIEKIKTYRRQKRVGLLTLWKTRILRSGVMAKDNTKPIEFRQLCALLRAIIQAEPSIDDAEWKARARDTLAKWGFAEPDTAMLARGLSAVEQAMRETVGPRPVRPIPTPSQPTTEPKPEPPFSKGRTSTPEGWDVVLRLMAKLRQSVASAQSSPTVPPPAKETLAVSEFDAVNEFWKATQKPDADRLALLKAFAEIAIVRPADWDYGEIRASKRGNSKLDGECFCCRTTRGGIVWHHIIQIQHGGSNYARNQVPICHACHSEIHPWLPLELHTARSGARGFERIGAIGERVSRRRKDRGIA